MIGSIRKSWQSAFEGHEVSTQAAEGTDDGVTRSCFLRMMAAGALAAGFSGSARAAVPAKASGVPPVTDIDKLYDAWQERMNSGDLEGLVDLYVENVYYVNPDGVALSGKAAVRTDLAGLLALKPQIVLGNRRHMVYENIALTTNHWRMNFFNADGVKQELTGGGIEVMRKEADGGWRYIIDDASRSAS
ncbi:DUF4440 domain-containing protein [Novosphingobium sp. KN65.2]|uniref:YybH family protein n=1 Tax=Novosphingobium sp. KN65.2 TaxID=1478134 RepID=UPI0005DC9DE0|nr:DUF4440 domain-containing protein [Novosphingobium sp. KN65.2]CDO35346.1 conserved hypothetical protein [Novosphingobium sp. KN65.2]